MHDVWLRNCGVEHADVRPPNVLWNPKIRNVMLVDLDSFTQEEEIEERFVSGQFPTVRYGPMTAVIHKCWRGKYNYTHEVVSDLEHRKSRESS
jgi:hypothetical protein